MAESICPWWAGYLLASPIRRLLQKPEEILSPYIKTGMTALDVGCAMGFFTLPMARLVGESGRVVAVDLQQKMLNSLARRLKRAGLIDRVDMRLCPATSLGLGELSNKIDFALTFAVLHETPDISAVFQEITRALKPGGRLLVAEPTGHVSIPEFESTLDKAKQAGLTIVETPKIRRSLTALMKK